MLIKKEALTGNDDDDEHDDDVAGWLAGIDAEIKMLRH